jgi:hypothetical protein
VGYLGDFNFFNGERSIGLEEEEEDEVVVLDDVEEEELQPSNLTDEETTEMSITES